MQRQKRRKRENQKNRGRNDVKEVLRRMKYSKLVGVKFREGEGVWKRVLGYKGKVKEE